MSDFWSDPLLLPYFMCTNSEGSGETARMRMLASAFAGHLCDKYHNLMSWLIWFKFWNKGIRKETGVDLRIMNGKLIQ